MAMIPESNKLCHLKAFKASHEMSRLIQRNLSSWTMHQPVENCNPQCKYFNGAPWRHQYTVDECKIVFTS